MVDQEVEVVIPEQAEREEQEDLAGEAEAEVDAVKILWEVLVSVELAEAGWSR